MKKLLAPFGSFILIFASVVCTIGAVISAFDFQIYWLVTVSVWAIAALAAVTFFNFWRGKGLLFLLIPVLIAIFFMLSEIIVGAKWSTFYITTEFNRWLFVPVLFEDIQIYDSELTIFFTVLGVVLTFLLSIAICLRQSALLTLLFTAPFVSLTFIIIFNHSAPGFLMGLLAIYLTMILIGGLSPDSFAGRGNSVFLALLLAVLLLLTTFVIAPPGDHDRGEFIRRIDNQIRSAASRAGIARIRTGIGWPVLHGDAWGFDTDSVSISSAGTRNIYDISVLEVTVSEPGIFYLRGYSMQYFDGNTWTINCDDVLDFNTDFLGRGFPAFIAHLYSTHNPERAIETVHMTISITGDVSRNVTYEPYFTLDQVPPSFPPPNAFEFFHVQDSILQLRHNLMQDLHFFRPDNFNHYFGEFDTLNDLINSPDTYLQIEDSSAEALRQFAYNIGISENSSREVIANQVASFMTGFGRYTLSPFIIPIEEDFVMYFLETSQHGFCIHYATAATMMMRALGVPARFTSGFVVTARPDDVGEPIDITDRYAHAWVEVFFDDVGWLPIEVTPPATGFGLGDGRPGTGIGTVASPGGAWYYDEPDFGWWPDHEQGNESGLALELYEQGASATRVSPLMQVVLVGIVLLLVISAPFVHRVVAKRTRAKHFSSDDTNLCVVFAWRYLEKLKRFSLGYNIPENIEDIAMKAKYSQHRISEEERLAFLAFADGFAEVVHASNSGFKLFTIKYVRGL